MRQHLSLILAGLTVLGLATACGPETSPTTAPTAAGQQQHTTAASDPDDWHGKVTVALDIKGDLTEHLAGTAGTCDAGGYYFSSKDVGATKDFTFQVETSDKPKLALNIGTESYFSYRQGADGKFDITTDKVTLDLNVLSFTSGSIHLKGSLTCERV